MTLSPLGLEDTGAPRSWCRVSCSGSMACSWQAAWIRRRARPALSRVATVQATT